MSLGVWRFFLAVLVAISHLWDGMIHGPAAYAVWGFFLISGYLMTVGLLTRYGEGWAGLLDYAINRFLRIYPTYYIACLFGALALFLMPKFGVTLSLLNPEFAFPLGWRDWMTNVFLVPIFGGSSGLVPVSGALGVEVGVYLLLPLLARGPAVALLGTILSGLLNIKYGIETSNFTFRYSSFLTAFMAFSIGSLVAHYRCQLKFLCSPLLSSLAWVANSLVWLLFDQWPWNWGLYFSLVLSAWVLISFADREAGSIDRWFGDLSYPVYLFHTVMAVWWFGIFEMKRTVGFFLCGMLGTILVSWIMVLFVDRPLEQRFKRRRIRVG